MKKILVTGAKGQLGKEIEAISQEYKNFDFLFTDVEELDITNQQMVEEFFTSHAPISYMINCAAYTAVDKAEDEPDKAFSINTKASEYLAEACSKRNILPVHISTDYVFDGTANRPVDENALTNPQSVYGDTKLKGEQAMILSAPEAIVIRTSWLYSRFGKNFVKSILHYGAERGELNEGVCSWYDFASASVKLAERSCKITPVTSDQYPQKAKRPAYSVLNKAKIRTTFGISIPYWLNSLNDYFELQK